MSSNKPVSSGKPSSNQRTRIADIATEGYKLSDEEISFVSGAKAPAFTHVTRPLIDNDPTGDTTNLGQKYLD